MKVKQGIVSWGLLLPPWIRRRLSTRHGMRHPGLLISSAFGAGLLTRSSSACPAVIGGIGASLLLLFALLAPAFLLRWRLSFDRRRAVAWLAAFFLLGLWRGAPPAEHGRFPPGDAPASGLPWVPKARPEAVVVEGTVDQPPIEAVQDYNGTRSLATLFSVTLQGGQTLQALVLGSLRGVPGGSEVAVAGMLLPSRGPRNPGDLQGAREPFLQVPHPGNVQIVEPRGRTTSAWILGAVRERFLRVLTELYPERTRGFILSMVLGDRRLLAADIQDALLFTGTYHLLAISGLHIVLIMFFVLRIPLPSPVRMPLRLFFLAGFTILTGGSPPVTRSALMFFLNLVGERFGRRPKGLNTLGWTAFLLLAADPSAVNDVGFQLSFIAVLSILTWGSRLSIRIHPARKDTRQRSALNVERVGLLRGALSKAGAGLVSSLAISLGTSAGTAPLILYYFQRVHPLGPIWNLIAYPLTLVSVVGGILSLILGLVHSAVGMPVAWLVDLGTRILLEPLIWGSKLPGSSLSIPSPPVFFIALAYLLLGAGLLHARGGVRLAAAACILGLTFWASSVGSGEAEIWTFDVGQGNASLLLLPGAGAFLVDAGALGNDSQAGSRLARSLLSTGTRSLRGVFLSHFHADHVRALTGLCDRIGVQEIWIPPYGSHSPLGQVVLELARERKIPVQTLHRGHSFWFPAAPDFHLDILHPEPFETLPFTRAPNDTSLTLRLAFRGKSVLFPGDLEEDGLSRLFEEESGLGAQILMAPHHGRTSLLWPVLLEKVRPSAVVISGTGDGGAESIAERLDHEHISVFATWRAGAVRTVLTPDRGWVSSYWRE